MPSHHMHVLWEWHDCVTQIKVFVSIALCVRHYPSTQLVMRRRNGCRALLTSHHCSYSMWPLLHTLQRKPRSLRTTRKDDGDAVAGSGADSHSFKICTASTPTAPAVPAHHSSSWPVRCAPLSSRHLTRHGSCASNCAATCGGEEELEG